MSEMILKRTSDLPMIVIRGLVIFPGALVHFDMVREKSIAALEEAMEGDQIAFLAMQKDITIENPKLNDIEKVGTICRIKQVVKMPSGMVRVLVEGLSRAHLDLVIKSEPFFKVQVSEYESTIDQEVAELELEALKRRLFAEFETYCSNNQKLNPEAILALESIDDPAKFTDAIASNLQIKLKEKQALLDMFSVSERMARLITILIQETAILEIDNEINRKVKENIDRNQKEYFLREQMKIIQEELGDKDGIGLEIKEYREKLEKAGVPDAVMEKCEQELDRLQKMPYGNPEVNVIRNYVSWICDLPWSASTEEKIDLAEAKKILERDHYGLQKIKERILEYLAVKQMTGSLSGPILCLVGPPGVGKTSIARSIAESLGKNYVRISLGGVRDEAEIRGHRKTYIGAMPGRIITAMKQAKSNNPLMLFDEIDKMSSDFHGDPASALLEVLDSEQNCRFRDHYLEVDFDLSKVMFIATANTLDTIPRPLLDRMEIVEISGYTSEEKFHICKKHLLPKQLKLHGLKSKMLKVYDGAIRLTIEGYTKEAGVRSLERKMGRICRKAALKISESESGEAVKVSVKNLDEFLGKRLFLADTASKKNEIGVVTGLAWTQVGGDTLSVEVNVMNGTGKIELTGQLGDVMQESAKAAISYIRSIAEKFGIEDEFYKNKDIHIHVPEGATPKDGPSAGITIATALASALSGRMVNHTVAMTGEITLRGRVLAIGGLKEKSLAAYRAGIQTILIPEDNKKDIDELETVVKENLTIIPVSTMDEVLKFALV
ncbi:MAG: endopeptidase La [Clostridia bacterium]|nr:endopeptidase La [Clostridia bacterium]